MGKVSLTTIRATCHRRSIKQQNGCCTSQVCLERGFEKLDTTEIKISFLPLLEQTKKAATALKRTSGLGFLEIFKGTKRLVHVEGVYL